LAMMSRLEMPVRSFSTEGFFAVFAMTPQVAVEFELDEAGRTSRPSSTLSLSERSPITRLSGGGSCLISVGVARIFSSSARCGCSRTSTISSSYRPSSSCPQIRLRLSIAIFVRGLVPVT
jgi:hypothetical protein